MNKIKLLITNCKSEINSLLDRAKGAEITHIIVTVNGDKIKCYESVELFSDETKILVATCKIGNKKSIISIDSNNINYIYEKYNDNSWTEVLNILNTDNNVVTKNYVTSIYG